MRQRSPTPAASAQVQKSPSRWERLEVGRVAKDEDEKKQQNANQYHDINKVQERVFETVTALNKKGFTLTDIAEKLGRTKEELQSYLNMYKTLAAVEHNLNVLLKES